MLLQHDFEYGSCFPSLPQTTFSNVFLYLAGTKLPFYNNLNLFGFDPGCPSVFHLSIYLFGVLCRFQHCTGHITTGSWKGRGNQYIQLVKVLYCKLPTNGKQLPAFPLEVGPGTELSASEVGGESVTTLPPLAPFFTYQSI